MEHLANMVFNKFIVMWNNCYSSFIVVVDDDDDDDDDDDGHFYSLRTRFYKVTYITDYLHL